MYYRCNYVDAMYKIKKKLQLQYTEERAIVRERLKLFKDAVSTEKFCRSASSFSRGEVLVVRVVRNPKLLKTMGVVTNKKPS